MIANTNSPERADHFRPESRDIRATSGGARRRTWPGVAVGALLFLTSCRSLSPPEVRDQQPAGLGTEEDTSASTFRLKPVEAAEEDPGFSPPLVATANNDGREGPVQFAWTAPCRVPVRHYNYRSDRGGSVMRMTLDFDTAGAGYRVRLVDFAFETVLGQPADSPELVEEVKRLEAAAAAAMPYFRVSADGEYRGLSDQDEIINFTLAEFGADASEQIADILRSPAMKQQIEAKAGDYWKSWVEVWDGLDLSPGETVSQGRRLPFFGAAFEAELVITNRGTLEAAPALRLYEARQVIEGPKATRIMLEHLRTLAKQTGGPVPADDAIQSFRRETTMHVAIDPLGARPHRARYLMVSEVDNKRRIEVTDWEFDWSRSQGCGI